MATKAKSGKPADSAEAETFVPAVPLDDVKPTRRRPPQVKEAADASVVYTVDERLKKLSQLPSLQKPVADTAPVMQMKEKSTRPPDPTPPWVEPQPSKDVDRGAPIPENYGLDRLAVFPRDSNWLYAYWELHGGALERLRFQHSAEIIDNARWVLRVRPVNESYSSLVDIDLRAGQWYLNVTPDNKLIIDMGFVDSHGNFVEVVKGCTVTTPRAGISQICDERWMIVREELEKLLRASGAGTETLSVASSERTFLPRSEQPRAIGIFSSHLLQGQSQGSGEPGA